MDTLNNVNREISKELNIPEDIVRKVNSYYWKRGVKEAISSGEHTSIRLKNIGTLAVSRHKINEKIVTLISKLRKLYVSEREFKKKTKEQVIEERKKELSLMCKRRSDIANVYLKNKQRRINVKLLETNLGQQTPDITGDSE